MALEVRRIVTGHDASGKAVITTDERLPAVSRLGRPHIAGCEIWSTDRMPIDNSEAADGTQRKGFVTRYNYVGTGQGTVIRITEFAPGAPKFMHRTETVDYALLLSGECDLELDSGEVRHLKAGDVVVQRGTMHAWVNHGPGPCVFAFILIDAEPAAAGGQNIDWHPAPRRQYIINLDAGVEITASDGEARKIGAGEVILVEDVSGKGHLSKALDGKLRHCIFVALD